MTAIREVVLARPVPGIPVAADFEIVERRLPAELPAGALRVRSLAIGLDPYIGQRIRGRHMGEPAPRPGEPLPGEAVAEVVASDSSDIAPGDLVVSHTGWAEEAIVPASAVRRVDRAHGVAEHLGVLGMPGLTAWAGITQLATVKPGDIVCVDAAAGVVGGTVGQLAKLAGATTVGIVGGPDKARIAADAYGFDRTIDYHADDWAVALPSDIAVHFENVGQRVLDAVVPRLRLYGQIILCGLAQHYGDGSVATLPVGPLVGKRAVVRGLVVYDFYGRHHEWVAQAAPLLRDGRLVEVHDIADGLEAAGAQMERVAHGRTRGRALVNLGLPA